MGESLPKSQVPRAVLAPLQGSHVVTMEKSGSSYVVRGIPGKLERFVEQHWGIRDLEQYAGMTRENRDRATLTAVAGDSKALPTSPLKGIFLRSFGQCCLGERDLGQTPPGSALLITLDELPHLRIKTDFLIGVENVECLWKFEAVRQYFPELKNLQFALVLRWHWGEAWARWLTAWKGQLLYFPDYDPAGINIFVNQILPRRNDARLLIPEGFEKLLQDRGNRQLYLKQERIISAQCEHVQVAHLRGIFMRIRKGLEQEEFLSDAQRRH